MDVHRRRSKPAGPILSAPRRLARAVRRPFTLLWAFLRSETGGGFLLIAASMLALVWANSLWAPTYFALLDVNVGVVFGPYNLSETVLHWINDGLMALFFLLVGLEIKREAVVGALSYTALPPSPWWVSLFVASMRGRWGGHATQEACGLGLPSRPTSLPSGLSLWPRSLLKVFPAPRLPIPCAPPPPRTASAPDGLGSSPLKRLEQALHPAVAYAVVPVFGLANAGVAFAA